jgi:hypothetical protein
MPKPASPAHRTPSHEIVPGSTGAPSRRAVVTAAVWSVPAVALAVAAPGAAASTVSRELVVQFDPWEAASLKGPIPFSLFVYDADALSTTWSGSFSVLVQLVADDVDVWVDTALSDPTPSPASTPGWTFTGWSSPSPTNVIAGTWSFSGSIAPGDTAHLAVDGTVYQRDASVGLPYTTTRTVTLLGITGSPSTPATGDGNVDSGTVQYG